MTILVTEDLTLPAGDPLRFCAAVIDDEDWERGGFGANEASALYDLIGKFPAGERDRLAGATIERAGVR